MSLKAKVDALQAANKEAEELEAKVAAEQDATKRAELEKAYDAKVADIAKLADDVDAEKKRADTMKRAKEVAKVEIDSKRAELSEEPKAKVLDSEHNAMRDTMERDAASRAYLTAPVRGAMAVLQGIQGKSEKLYEAITVERKDGRQGGVRPPSYMQNFIHAKMAGWNPRTLGEAIMGKTEYAVLARDSSGTQSGGGSLVPDQFVAELYRLPELDTRLIDLCLVKTAVGGTAYFPKLTQSTNRFGVAFVSSTEGNSKPRTDPVFTRTSVTTGEISGLTSVSHKELRVNNVGLEAELAWMFRGAWNEFINKQILQKSDANSQFVGINTDAAMALGVVEVSREAAGAVSWKDLMGLVFGIEAGAMSEAKLILKSGSTGAMAAIAALDDTNNRPVFQNLLSASWAGGAQSPPTIAGCPYVLTPDLVAILGARGDVICGSFRNYGVAIDQDITIDRSDEFHFDRDMATYRVIGYAGGLILGPSCFAVLSDVSGVSSSSESSSTAAVSQASSGADD